MSSDEPSKVIVFSSGKKSDNSVKIAESPIRKAVKLEWHSDQIVKCFEQYYEGGNNSNASVE